MIPYELPNNTITWVSGQPLPPQYLSKKVDVDLVAKETGGVIANGADFFKPFGIEFKGLISTDDWQPWVITLDGSTNFVGPTIKDMWAPNSVNGGGVNNSGSLQKINSQWKWVPTAPPVVVTPTPSSAADLAGYLSALGLSPSEIPSVDQMIIDLLIEIKTLLQNKA